MNIIVATEIENERSRINRIRNRKRNQPNKQIEEREIKYLTERKKKDFFSTDSTSFISRCLV